MNPVLIVIGLASLVSGAVLVKKGATAQGKKPKPDTPDTADILQPKKKPVEVAHVTTDEVVIDESIDAGIDDPDSGRVSDPPAVAPVDPPAPESVDD